MPRSHHINKNTSGSLQDNLPLRLRYLKTWFSCSHADWISLESMVFLESVYNWERTLRFKSPKLFPVKTLLPAQSWKCEFSLFLLPYLLSASTIPYHVGPLSPGILNPNKYFCLNKQILKSLLWLSKNYCICMGTALLSYRYDQIPDRKRCKRRRVSFDAWFDSIMTEKHSDIAVTART